MIKTLTVVNLKNSSYDIYIGRANGRYKLSRSIWHNPYKEDKPGKKRDGTKEEILEKYREYILSKPELLNRLPELEGKRLGCYCKPEACHGDVLVELFENLLIQADRE